MMLKLLLPDVITCPDGLIALHDQNYKYVNGEKFAGKQTLGWILEYTG